MRESGTRRRRRRWHKRVMENGYKMIPNSFPDSRFIFNPSVLAAFLALAHLWKNLEFLSPSCSHIIRERWRHSTSSNLRQSQRVDLLNLFAANSSSSRSLYSSKLFQPSNSFGAAFLSLIGPLLDSTHSLIFDLRRISFLDRVKPPQPSTSKLFHHSLTKPKNWGFSNQILLKRKGLGP